jgi:hypothetical protein
MFLLFALWRSGLLKGLLSRLSSFNAFGVAFKFDEGTAKETRDTIETGLESVRATIQRELEAEVRARSLQYGLETILAASRLSEHYDYRATIHIPDPLYENGLYQLLDYFPRGAGHGRTFSARAGLIGLAWRTDSKREWIQSSAITLPMLMQEWGMTQREAAERRVVDRTKVMMAIPLHDVTGARKVGVLYLDSENHDYFGATEDERQALRKELNDAYQVRLADQLSELVEAAKRRSPQLSLQGI